MNWFLYDNGLCHETVKMLAQFSPTYVADTKITFVNHENQLMQANTLKIKE